MAAIEHVVVLMLENRSFDSMLGKLYPAGPNFNGLTGLEANSYGGQPLPVWTSGTMDADVASTPTPDPGELFTDMTFQLFGGPAGKAPPSMGGFVGNYMAQPAADRPFDPRSVLHYFTPEQVPIISTLAKAFGVCDQWHASAPCQTWPNRFFVHTGTALGYVNNSQFPIPFPAPSIFHQLQTAGRSWRVYFHDVPQSLLLRDIWLSAPLHYRFFDQFLVDANNGVLPNYSFIEPRYFTDTILREIPNDEHPPHNIMFGEQLIANVYNAVRNSPCWKKTLLIITCDEHGGCFDHAPPPNAIPPDSHNQEGFDFDRYGVRVPAVLVSPYIPAGSIIRAAPQGVPHDGPPYPFDHTSILATLSSLFNLAPLTARVRAAPNLLSALSLPLPINDGPKSITVTTPTTTTTTASNKAKLPPNHMQTNLARMAASLPVSAPTQITPEPIPMADVTPPTVAVAAANAIARVKSFLNL